MEGTLHGLAKREFELVRILQASLDQSCWISKITCIVKSEVNIWVYRWIESFAIIKICGVSL
jgi:hypothetical protein